MSQITPQTITEKQVSHNQRLGFLPKHFGITKGLRFEQYVYHFMGELAETYSGGFWEYVELSNGGVYMLWSSKAASVRMVSPCGNEAVMSVKAASIVANLYALCQIGDIHYHDLLAFARYTLSEEDASALALIID